MEDTRIILGDFFSQIWREEKGHVYLAFKHPVSGNWKRQFHEWPVGKEDVITSVIKETPYNEVYFAPAIFKESGDSSKANVAGSYCFWVEFDGPGRLDLLDGLPLPTVVVRSSTEDHRHAFWCLSEFTPPEQIEKVNKALTYLLEGDISGWDCCQILRPPETLNHKRSKRTSLITFGDTLVAPSPFFVLPDPIPVGLVEIPKNLPEALDVVRKYAWTDSAWNLFVEGAHDRSAGLMSLGYHLAEMRVTNAEAMAILIHADKKWGKFYERSDQITRLTEIITKARLKYPEKPSAFTENLPLLGFSSLLQNQTQVDWAWEEFLHKQGYMLVTGPTGVGKSQFSLNAGMNLALGKEFLGRATAQMKLAYLSLEMGEVELKVFVEQQAQGYTPEEQAIIDENLKFLAFGESLYMNQVQNQMLVEKMIQDNNLQGLIIDSLSSSMSGELTGESEVKSLMDWLDQIRKEHEMFVWFIHHHRKAQGQNKSPNKIDDIYGSYLITARASTVLCLWPRPTKRYIECIALKTRLARKPDPFPVAKDSHLLFSIVSGERIIPEEQDEETTSVGEEDTVDVTEEEVETGFAF